MSRSLYAKLNRRFGPRLSGRETVRRVRDRIDGARERFPLDDLFAAKGRKRAAGAPKLVVVGGGFAGLMAGYALNRYYDVTVVEARDRVGGRVWSRYDNADRRVTEQGGELIGYCHPLWLLMAQSFQLGLSVITSEADAAAMFMETPMFLGGELLPPEVLETVYDEMTEAFTAMGNAAVAAVPDPNQPWLAKGAAAFDNTPLSSWIAASGVSDLAKAAMEAQFANNNGAPSARQSELANFALIAACAKHGGKDSELNFFNLTETVRCEQGNQSLAFAMRDAIIEGGGQVQTSNPVTGVHVGDDRVSLATANGPMLADYVVLATPPSTWNRMKITPGSLDDHKMTMGYVVKYLSRVDSRFWIGEHMAPSSVSETYGMTWEGTDNQMQVDGQSLEMSLFAGGPAAEAALARYKAGPKELRAFYDNALARVYPDYPASREADPSFIAWPLEPWTAAGYSCPAPGEVCTIGPKLQAPYYERLFFAGEHTSPGFFGYMEGALESGLKVASKLYPKA